MTHADVTSRLRERARELGFSLFGVAAADASRHADHYRDWIGRGFHGEMAYLARPDAVRRRRDPTETLAHARSIIVVAHEYGAQTSGSGGNGISGNGVPEFGVPDAGAGAVSPDPPTHADRAVVARYARGEDYHDVLLAKLELLGAEVTTHLGRSVGWKAYVDTGPVLERDVAQRAGLGWFGRNTMLIHPRRGSWFVLGVVFLDQEIEPTPPFEDDRCGSCRACLDGCPTGALLGRDEAGAPVMDARRCISYLTIEQKGAIDPELRPLMSNRVFGCDICQEVCPWNQRFGAEAEGVPEYRALPDLDDVGLVDFARRLLPMSEKAYQREFLGSPLARPRRRGMLRNLCVGIGNWLAIGSGGAEEAIEVLARAVEDRQPLVRGHAAWALGRARSARSRTILEGRLSLEEDQEVRAEIIEALAHFRGSATSG